MELNRILNNLKSTQVATNDMRETLEVLSSNDHLIKGYLIKSPNLNEIFKQIENQFDNFDQIRLNDFKESYLTQLFNVLFKCFEKSNESNEQLCEQLIKKHLNQLQICLSLKSTTKNASDLKEICFKLLGKCIETSKLLAKQIAIQFEYFSERKTCLTKIIKTNFQSLREACIRFLFDFLKYYQSDDEFIIIIKKIFFIQTQDTSYSTIHAIFSTINQNSLELIEFILEELLFKIVKNEKFTKSDKVKLFNDRNLTCFMRLYEWQEEENEDRKQIVYEMINEFLKILFCSTHFGISFHDKSFLIDGNGKNYNHLIYNSIISVKINTLNETLVNDLLLRVFKVCPDLIQRFLKFKLKNQEQTTWLINFAIKLFDYQKSLIRNPSSNLTSILNTTHIHNVEMLSNYIINTSFIINLPFNRIYSNDNLRESLIDLLVLNLSCLNEWKNRLKNTSIDTYNIFNQVNIKLFSLKYLPPLNSLNINETTSKINDKLIKLMSSYFDLFLNNADLYETQINSLNFDFIQSLLDLNNDKLHDDNAFNRAINYIEFVLKYFKLNTINTSKLDFIYKLLRLLVVYSNNNQITLLIDYVNRFLQLNLSKEEYDENNLTLFLVLFVKNFQNKIEEDEKKYNFLVDFVDTTLRTLLNQKRRIFKDDKDLKYSLPNCAIGILNDFKAKYSNSIECLEKVKSFLNDYLNLSTLIDINFNTEAVNYDFQSINDNPKKIYKTFCDKISINSNDNLVLDNLKALNLLSLLKSHKNDHDFMFEELSRFIKTNEAMQQAVLNDSFVLENIYFNRKVTAFCNELIETVEDWQLIEKYLESFKKFQSTHLNNEELIDNFNDSYRLLSKIRLKPQYFKNLIENSIGDEFLYKSTEYVNLIFNNKAYFLDDLSLFAICLKKLVKINLKHHQDGLELNKIDDLLVESYQYKPKLFSFILNKAINKKKSSIISILKSLSKFSRLYFSNENEQKINGITNGKSETSVEQSPNYTYTLSKQNQLMLIEKYALNGNLDEFKFRYNEKLKLNNLSNIEIKTNDFINEVINEKQMQQSIFKYPTTRRLSDLDNKKLYSTNTFDNDEYFEDDIYDPIYMLLNLYTLLDYGNFVEVSFFIKSSCFSYLIVALSSECENLRALAYGSLYRFNQQLENSRIFCKNELLFLIQLLRNSLSRENQKIPFVVSLFIAQLIPIILEPGLTLYKPIMSFLLIKPTLDLTNVPEFFKFFNSSSLDFKTERKWLLNIIRYGIRTTLEYRLYEKRFIYRQLFSIFDSKLTDYDLKFGIIELLKSTCNIKHALIDLIKRHCFLLWLTSTITNLDEINTSRTSVNIFYNLIEIYLLIWKNLTIKGASTQLPFLFVSQMFLLMKIILDKLVLMPHVLTLESDEQPQDSSDIRSNCIKKIYKRFFIVSKELLQCLSEHFKVSTYNLNEDDIDKYHKIVLDKQEFDLKVEFYQLLVNSSFKFCQINDNFYKNLKYVLNFTSNKTNIASIDTSKLFSWLNDGLILLNQADNYTFEKNYDHHFNIAVNLVETLSNMPNCSKDFKEQFYCFIKKFQNQMEHDGIDEEKEKILNENFNYESCFSLIIN